MGYSTDIAGLLRFKHEVNLQQLKYLNAILGNYEKEIPGGKDGFTKEISYIQWEVDEQYEGLVWDGGEKFYYIDNSIEFVIYKMNKQFPDRPFDLEGVLYCQGESLEDRYKLLVSNKTVIKEKSKVKLARCPECYHTFELKDTDTFELKEVE